MKKITVEQGVCKSWMDTLIQVRERLDRVISSNEESFLAMGEKLRDYYGRAQKMCGNSKEVVDMMSGEGLNRATEGLTLILEDLKSHLGESEGHFSRIQVVFHQYLETLKKVFSYLDEFDKIVLNLSMLGFLTRVENAHIFSDDSGFASLIDDVKRLSETIKKKSSHIKSQSAEVQSFIIHALSKVVEFKKGKGFLARDMLNKTVANHKALSDKYASALQSAQIISERAEGIASSIEKIVMSLQFHDITRQQIEHVKEVVESLSKRVSSPDHQGNEISGLVSEVVDLQIAQIKQSRDDLVNAVIKIKQNLQTIAKSIEQILDETRDVAWASETEGLSFMEDMDNGISSVIDSINANAQEQAMLTETVSTSSVMVSDMSGFVHEIENLGLNLQLIALNARIKAAHIGMEGAALDTISGGIYELSKNAREETRNLSELLSSLVHTSDSFDSDLKGIRESQQTTVHAIVVTLRDLTDSLHLINDSVLSTLTGMTCDGETLMKEIYTTASEISVHKEVEGELDDLMNSLSEITHGARFLSPERQIQTAVTFLTDIDKLYTMESERNVHTRHVEEPEVAAGQRGNGVAADDLGENVELF
ncbi:MAG: methyl-accepting chemotaxis protein [Desulfomonilia bacterium]|jgi:ABC-type transporter Mla subunit MlaD